MACVPTAEGWALRSVRWLHPPLSGLPLPWPGLAPSIAFSRGNPGGLSLGGGPAFVWPGVANCVYFAKPRGGLCWVVCEGAHTQPDVKPAVS